MQIYVDKLYEIKNQKIILKNWLSLHDLYE